MFSRLNWNLAIAWTTASIIFGFIFVCALIYNNGQEKYLFFLSAVFGASIGWVLGILATPFDPKEKVRLSEIAKIVYGFLTGYLISKIDIIFNNIILKNLLIQKELWIFGMVIITTLLTTLTTTYINRSYWLEDINKQRIIEESRIVEKKTENTTE